MYTISKYLGLLFILCFFVSGCFSDEPIESKDALSNPDGGADGGDADTNSSSDPDGCNPKHEPTWETPINQMVQTQCSKCHEETKTYEAITPWIQNGLLKQYCEMGTGHFLTSGQEDCLRWVEIGAPKTPCDVL